MVAAGAAVPHLRGAGATHLGVEVGSAAAAGESRGSPRHDFSSWREGLVATRVSQITPAAAALPASALRWVVPTWRG
jgi:hypothetical protein